MSDSIYDERLWLDDTGTTTGTDYFSAWLETKNALHIRVEGYFPGSGFAVTVQESPDASSNHITSVHSLGSVSGNQFNGECDLAARYFRLRVETDQTNTFFAVVRATEVA